VSCAEVCVHTHLGQSDLTYRKDSHGGQGKRAESTSYSESLIVKLRVNSQMHHSMTVRTTRVTSSHLHLLHVI
jgi:hypothetical protein